MITEAAAMDYRAIIFLMLLMAPAGTFLSIGLKLAWFTFLGRDSGLRPKEAPTNMLIAMGIAAFLCFAIGVYPAPLYALLPGPVDYNAYNITLILKELQLLLFTGLGFFLLLRFVGGKNYITLDTDWIYRGGGKRVVLALRDGIIAGNHWVRNASMRAMRGRAQGIRSRHGRDGKLARSWPTGSMAMWTAILLASLLLFGIRN